MLVAVGGGGVSCHAKAVSGRHSNDGAEYLCSRPPVFQVRCRDQDFHSGTFGGILHEPMADLVALLGNVPLPFPWQAPGTHSHTVLSEAARLAPLGAQARPAWGRVGETACPQLCPLARWSWAPEVHVTSFLGPSASRRAPSAAHGGTPSCTQTTAWPQEASGEALGGGAQGTGPRRLPCPTALWPPLAQRLEGAAPASELRQGAGCA